MYSSVELIFDLYISERVYTSITKYLNSSTPKKMDASNLLRFAGIEKMEDGSIFIYEHPNAILQYIYNSLLGKWCWMVYSYLLHICFETCILIGHSAVTWGVLFYGIMISMPFHKAV